MKVILVLVLVLVNGQNMRSNKGTAFHDNLVEITSHISKKVLKQQRRRNSSEKLTIWKRQLRN